MENDYYAMTFYDKKGIFNHIIFYVYVRLKYSQFYTEKWEVKALIDTGATQSCITDRLVKRMKLTSNETHEFSTAKGKMTAPIHIVDLILPKDKVFENLEVGEIIDDDKGYDFVIGMDILKQGDMAITNASGKMMFSFRMPPAKEHTDYEYELLKQQYPDEEIEKFV